MAETLFQKGDKVRVKVGVTHHEHLGHPDEMDKYGGNVYTVQETCVGKESKWYWLDECLCDEDTHWIFHEDWLEPAYENTLDIEEKEIEKLFN